MSLGHRQDGISQTSVTRRGSPDPRFRRVYYPRDMIIDGHVEGMLIIRSGTVRVLKAPIGCAALPGSPGLEHGMAVSKYTALGFGRCQSPCH